MEKESIPHSPHSNKIKNMLAVGAIFFVLLGNSDTIVAQTQQTNQDLAKNINKTNEDIVKQYFINNFSPVINSIDTVADFPIKVKYKNISLAQRYDFPDSIDISPKIIEGSPKRLIVVTIDEKKYNIVPYRGIKVKSMKIISDKSNKRPNKSLDEPKAILTLELAGFLPWNIEITSKEFTEYIYELSRINVGQKKSMWGIHVEVLARNPKPSTSPKNLTDSNTVKNDPILASHATD